MCLLPHAVEDAWMQSLACEMNLSETAFLHPEKGGYRLRWFTPLTEVDLCGHATLASAHVLWEHKVLSADKTAVFLTRSGMLYAKKKGDWIELEFPSTPPQPCPVPAGLESALGVQAMYCGWNETDFLIEIKSLETLKQLTPDLELLRTIETRGVIVTCPSNSKEFNFYSRFFAPRVGIDEDPVTGSAHCCLAPYWSEKLGINNLSGYQSSSRGGFVRMENHPDKVILGGQAVTIFSGKTTS